MPTTLSVDEGLRQDRAPVNEANSSGVSWGAVIGGAGWIKAADRLSEIYRASGLTKVMTEAPTWAGLVSKVPLVRVTPTPSFPLMMLAGLTPGSPM